MKYSNIFNGIGKISRTYEINLTENDALKANVKEKLDQMFEENILNPVTKRTDWILHIDCRKN